MATDPTGTGDGYTPEQRLEMQKLRVEESRTAWILWSIIGVITVVSLVGVFVLLSGSSNRVADVAYARGLITVLFSVGVVAMALILVLSVLMQRQEPADPQANEKRFQRAKEILSLLLGILGTVVGFYFGTSTSVSIGRASVVGVSSSNESPTPGDQVELTVLIDGGQPPFAYQIRFEGLEIGPIEGETRGRWVKELFSIPAEIGDARKLTATVEITDGVGNESVLSKEFELRRPVVDTDGDSASAAPAELPEGKTPPPA